LLDSLLQETIADTDKLNREGYLNSQSLRHVRDKKHQCKP